MVGGSLISASPAFAVDSEIVGSDRDGALICGEGLPRRYSCCFAAAASNADCAVCCPLGDEEKKLVSLAALENDDRRLMLLSDDGMATAEVLELANGFCGNLRGMAAMES